MQRQAVPLIRRSPLVGTGMERVTGAIRRRDCLPPDGIVARWIPSV